MHYIPKVGDYVRWKNHEGWVYFKCDTSISIEIGVKDVICTKGTCHKKNHILLVCANFQWDELEYIKNRFSILQKTVRLLGKNTIPLKYLVSTSKTDLELS